MLLTREVLEGFLEEGGSELGIGRNLSDPAGTGHSGYREEHEQRAARIHRSFIYFLPGSLKVFLMINRDQHSPNQLHTKK